MEYKIKNDTNIYWYRNHWYKKTTLYIIDKQETKVIVERIYDDNIQNKEARGYNFLLKIKNNNK